MAAISLTCLKKLATLIHEYQERRDTRELEAQRTQAAFGPQTSAPALEINFKPEAATSATAAQQ